MASLIPGYEYDIFISYRQKDNKYDGWVSEFVDNLKKELEATFKEEISVYFDINPHDGLLETHDVDESLKEKLKSLIFIPVISRTYCDPRSFAWEHEFKAFVEMASVDPIGLKVKLPNGNVASRILPVQIHDLEPEDRKTIESVLGGFIRGIEFIYKETGVDRPLNAKDNEEKNLNKTSYRNQINKVALAIKQIVSAIKRQEQGLEPTLANSSGSSVMHWKNNRMKILIGSVLTLLLIVFIIWFIPKLLKPSKELEKSIAVLPFKNLSNDPEQEYFSEGVVETIITHLYKVGDLKVVSSTSTEKFKNTELSIKEIAKELGASSILEGSVQKKGNSIRITAQLIDSRTDIHIWSEIYDRDISDIFSIESEVAQNVAEELKAVLTSDEKKQISNYNTQNVEAYNLYLQGRYFVEKRILDSLETSIRYFEKAIAADSNYALAYAGLSETYGLLASYGRIKRQYGFGKSIELSRKALTLDKNLAEPHAILGTMMTYQYKWEEARRELLLAIKLNPKFPTGRSYYAELLGECREFEEALKQVNIGLELDPFSPFLHTVKAVIYFYDSKYKESLDEWIKIKQFFPDRRSIDIELFMTYAMLGDGLQASEALRNAFMKNSLYRKYVNDIEGYYKKSGLSGLMELVIKTELERQNPLIFRLAFCYAWLGNNEEALKWMEKGISIGNYIPCNIANITSPVYNNLHSMSGFTDLINKLGLSEYYKSD